MLGNEKHKHVSTFYVHFKLDWVRYFSTQQLQWVIKTSCEMSFSVKIVTLFSKDDVHNGEFCT